MINNPQGRTIFRAGYCIGKATNNVAEYTALLRGLEQASRLGIAQLHIYGDSQLMVRQINGQYRVREEQLQKLHDQAHQLLERFDRWQITHIPREKNASGQCLMKLLARSTNTGTFRSVRLIPPGPMVSPTG